ncbi:hypothetical protein B5S29_g3516 [[Candida] boidinii]|nr:hypothetical protein B5S29_g3516 [[Candida] boidinii]
MSFVPAQFSQFTNTFDFDKLRNDTSSSLGSRIRSLRSPHDFFDYKRISVPKNIHDLTSKITFNIKHFTSNYILIVALLSAYCILTNLPLLILVLFVAGSIFFVQKLEGAPLNLGFIKFETTHLYTIILLISLPLLIISSPMTTIFWLASISGSIVFVHAALLDKPVESSYSDAV